MLKCSESLLFFVPFDLVAVRAKQLVPSSCVPQHSHVVSQAGTTSPSNLRAAAAVDMVYLQRPNVFIKSAAMAPWTILLMDLLKHLTLSFGARMFGHSFFLIRH